MMAKLKKTADMGKFKRSKVQVLQNKFPAFNYE